jgi:hypothetical protein
MTEEVAQRYAEEIFEETKIQLYPHGDEDGDIYLRSSMNLEEDSLVLSTQGEAEAFKDLVSKAYKAGWYYGKDKGVRKTYSRVAEDIVCRFTDAQTERHQNGGFEIIGAVEPVDVYTIGQSQTIIALILDAVQKR